MYNPIPRLKKSFSKMFPTMLYFFVVFQLLALTQALMLDQFDSHLSTFINATIAALVIGKVILVANYLPFMNKFPDKPRIYNILWKTFVYMLAALLFRYVEHLIHLIGEHGSLGVAHTHFLKETVWSHFWLVQMWLFVCALLYATAGELGFAFGRERIKQWLFGPRQETSA